MELISKQQEGDGWVFGKGKGRVSKELFGGWFEFLVGVIVGLCVEYVFIGLLGMKQLTFKWDKCVSFLVVLI